MICDPFPAYVASAFRIKYATEAWERAGASRLRRQVFCQEQGVFARDDRDLIDLSAIPIVAISMLGVGEDEVVGTVRIWQSGPSLWWGGRLAVAGNYRKTGMLGSSLIRLAVCSAHARGCEKFLAYVQSTNAPLFHRLHWQTLDEINLHGRPHHVMEADLAFYPPFATPETGFQTLRKAA